MRIREAYCHRSLNYFARDDPVRLTCIHTMESYWFGVFIITLIFINSLFLGLIDYTWDEASGRQKPLGNRLTEKSEIFFTVAFTIEMCVKVVAMGFILDENCYLRDAWNWLDFIVVVTALMQEF